MGMLERAGKDLKKKGILKGRKIAMALHVEAKTAVLALTLQEAGATVRLASCNPLSTDDDVASALKSHYKLDVAAKRGIDRNQYYANLKHTLDNKPDLVIDDGADLTQLIHKDAALLKPLRGICEETTTGILRARAMHRDGKLRTAVLDVNGAKMKHLFDNRYGTGQSALDGFLRATNLSIAGKTFLIAGYGWCGRGLAMRARGMGADVIVTEIDPVRALEARYDGFRVRPVANALKEADVVITATGNAHIVAKSHIPLLRDGTLLANAGHFDVEIDKAALKKASKKHRIVRPEVEEYTLKNGRRVHLLADGRLINLVAGSGHPVEVMDGSFAVQALGVAHLADEGFALGPGVHSVPADIDERVARYALKTMGITIDRLTPEQRTYLGSYTEGT
jgi:adenosylhomocysteinase